MDDIGGGRARGASGRFVLRLEPGLHAALRRVAAEAGVSLNEYCTRLLAAPAGPLAGWRGPAAAVARGAALLGEELVAVVVYGSWARDELHDRSDVDVLVVVDSRVPLTRDLYRRWDEERVVWDGRPVEPHFAHLPDPDRGISGLWAELALDGVVLYTRDLELPRRLARIRRALCQGRIVGRNVHGQPYWVGAA